MIAQVAPTAGGYIGYNGRRALSPLSQTRLERVLRYLLDENEFLSPYGIRSLSKYHQDHPFTFQVSGQTYGVSYVPAESDTGMFGGNSNWRGPVWMPVNVLIVRGLLNLYAFYGDDFTVECPTGSGIRMTLFEVAKDISGRLAKIFLRGDNGRRPGLWRHRQVPGRSALAGPTSCSTSTSTATTGPASAPATRPVGRAPSPACLISSVASGRQMR